MTGTRRHAPAPSILYVDDELVVVDKPPGVPSVPGRVRFSRHTVGVLMPVSLFPR